MKDPGVPSAGAIELNDYGTHSQDGDTYSDADAVARLHVKPTIPRTLKGLIGLIGVNSSVVSAWPIFFLTSVLSLANGGTLGFLIGVLVTTVGLTPTYISLAEKIRAYPTAGGQYHWVAALAPPKMRHFLSFYCGFMLGTCASMA
jgi:choline transport protein